MQKATDPRRVDGKTTFSQCRRQLMKCHVGLDLVQDDSTMLPVVQIGPVTAHLARCRTSKATLARGPLDHARHCHLQSRSHLAARLALFKPGQCRTDRSIE